MKIIAAPNRRVAQRRVKNPDVWHPAIDKIRRFGSYDRRQNAAGQVDPVKAISTGQPVSQSDRPVPAAPASTLPLSAEQIADFRDAYGHTERYRVLCDQALRAIELEQQVKVQAEWGVNQFDRAEKAGALVAGLRGEWFRKGQESVRRKNESGCCCKIGDDDEILSACNAHAEWAGRQLAEKDRGYAILHGQFVEMRNRWKIAFDLKEKAEALVAEKDREIADAVSILDEIGIPFEDHSNDKKLTLSERVNLLSYYWQESQDSTQHDDMLLEINTLQAELAELKARVK